MSQNYLSTLQRIYTLLDQSPDPDKRDSTEEGWSIKEIVGHLVDSCSNNHQRLSRYRANDNIDFPGYDQLQFVRRAHYNAFDFKTLLSLWFNYNQLFLHIVDQIPPQELQSTVSIGGQPAITIEFLVEDYFAHMEIHEEQIKRIING